MARRKKDVADEGMKARRRKLKSRERRERKKEQREESSAPLDSSWLQDIMTVGQAQKIIDKERARPYWLSIPFEVGDGNPPVAGVTPCTMFRTRERVYYGFLFRQHRERVMVAFDNAQRELTSFVYDKFPGVIP